MWKLPLFFLFAVTAALGDLVWLDSNGNGVQDAGEPGVAGVVVELLQGSTVIANTTTSSSGLYSFTDLTPGTYSVVFHAPSGYSFSPALQGSNASLDSDVIVATTGQTGTITLAAGETNNNVDAGLVPGKSCSAAHSLCGLCARVPVTAWPFSPSEHCFGAILCFLSNI